MWRELPGAPGPRPQLVEGKAHPPVVEHRGAADEPGAGLRHERVWNFDVFSFRYANLVKQHGPLSMGRIFNSKRNLKIDLKDRFLQPADVPAGTHADREAGRHLHGHAQATQALAVPAHPWHRVGPAPGRSARAPVGESSAVARRLAAAAREQVREHICILLRIFLGRKLPGSVFG